METNFITLSFAFILPLIVIILLIRQDSVLTKRVLKVILTMLFQLLISVVILTLLFKNESLIYTLIFMSIMMFYSFKTLKKSIKSGFKYMNFAILSVVIGSSVTIAYLITILSFSNNALTPRYIIPLFGMLLGNTTTAVILAANEIENILKHNKVYICTLIDLGVSTKVAVNEQFKRFVVVALTPTLTSMLNIGIVSIPGMMSGQILAGASPVSAVMYQVMIMFGILFSITVSVLCIKLFILKDIVNKNSIQLD